MRALAAMGLAVAILPTGALAQAQEREARAAAEGVASRFIGEWAYLPVSVVAGPFATSYVSSSTGIGGYTLDLEFELPPPLDVRTTDLDYQALLQRFDAQLSIFRRVGLRVELQGEAVLPDTGLSALSVALNGTWGAGGGVLVQLLSTDRIMFSLTGDYQFLQRTVVSPAGALGETVEDIRFAGLFTRQDVHGAMAGGSFASAFTDWLGLVAEAGWEGQWPESSRLLGELDGNNHFLVLAGALSANFWQERIPLGATAFWRERIPIGGSNTFDFSRQYGVAAFYSGRPGLDVGVELFLNDEEQEAGNFVRQAFRYYVAPRIRGYF